MVLLLLLTAPFASALDVDINNINERILYVAFAENENEFSVGGRSEGLSLKDSTVTSTGSRTDIVVGNECHTIHGYVKLTFPSSTGSLPQFSPSKRNGSRNARGKSRNRIGES